jgi:hypothetical protein
MTVALCTVNSSLLCSGHLVFLDENMLTHDGSTGDIMAGPVKSETPVTSMMKNSYWY